MRILPKEIAFDIDGVVADTFRLFVEMAVQGFGYQFTYEDITEYDFRKVVDIAEEDSDAIIRELLENPVKSGIKPIKGAVEVLTRLAGVAPLVFVTARPEKTPIIQWIYHQLPDVDRDLIHLEATNTHGEKLPVLLEKKIKYFVEDRLDTCYLLSEASVTPIVFEQPWNRKHHPFSAVRDWAGLSSLILC